MVVIEDPVAVWQVLCVLVSSGSIHNFVRISLILALIISTLSRAYAMPHQQDVAHIVPVCADGLMIVVMLDVNGNPIKKQAHCPDCISALALAFISTGVVTLHDVDARVHHYWTTQAQRASMPFDGFQQRGPPIYS